MFVVLKETGFSGNTGTTTFKGHENLSQNYLPNNRAGWSYLADCHQGNLANVVHLNNGLGICQEGPFMNSSNAADCITGVNKVYAINTRIPNAVVGTDSVVTACSTVVGVLPAGGIYGGNPAVFVKPRQLGVV